MNYLVFSNPQKYHGIAFSHCLAFSLVLGVYIILPANRQMSQYHLEQVESSSHQKLAS